MLDFMTHTGKTGRTVKTFSAKVDDVKIYRMDIRHETFVMVAGQGAACFFMPELHSEIPYERMQFFGCRVSASARIHSAKDRADSMQVVPDLDVVCIPRLRR